MQAAYEQAASSAPQVPVQAVEEQIPMDVDSTTTERGTKRGAEDEPPKDHKKVKLGKCDVMLHFCECKLNIDIICG